MIQVTNIHYKYDTEFNIKNISFSIENGETLAVVGASGSGKSTILKLILGAYIPDGGSIIVDYNDITNLVISKRYIGYCPQEQLLFPHLNVFENIAIGLRGKISKEDIKARVESLATMSGIFPLLQRKPDQLSGGQKQRVSILRALATQPKVLLLDEPFHNLDAQIKNQIVDYIKKIQLMTNIAVILVTHDISEAKSLADRILILQDGRMIQLDTPNELVFSPNCYDVAKIMGMPNIYLIKQSICDEKGENSVLVSFGKLFVIGNKHEHAKAMYIDPKAIKINPMEENEVNNFKGIVKTINNDILTEKKVISIQILTLKTEQEENEELDGLIQITREIFDTSLEKNQKVQLVIDSKEIQFFQN